MSFHSDYKEYFFKKSDVSSMLSEIGFPIDLDAQNKDSDVLVAHDSLPITAQESSLNWMKRYAAKRGLRIQEMAFLLEGEEPDPNGIQFGSFDVFYNPNKIKHNEDQIIDLVIGGDISCLNTNNYVENRPDTWLIDQQSIDEWAARTGIEWPLSRFRNQGSVSTGDNANTSTESVARDKEIITKLEQHIKAQDEEVARLRENTLPQKQAGNPDATELQVKVNELQQQVDDYEYWLNQGKAPLPAFGLFIETFVPDVPKYNFSEKLNVTRVLETLQTNIPEHVEGMKDRTLREIIKASMKAWKDKKKENSPQNR